MKNIKNIYTTIEIYSVIFNNIFLSFPFIDKTTRYARTNKNNNIIEKRIKVSLSINNFPLIIPGKTLINITSNDNIPK